MTSDSYEVNQDMLLFMKRITAKEIEKEKQGHKHVVIDYDLDQTPWSPEFEELVDRIIKPEDLRPRCHVLVEENPFHNLEKLFPDIFSSTPELQEEVDDDDGDEIKKLHDADADADADADGDADGDEIKKLHDADADADGDVVPTPLLAITGAAAAAGNEDKQQMDLGVLNKRRIRSASAPIEHKIPNKRLRRCVSI